MLIYLFIFQVHVVLCFCQVLECDTPFRELGICVKLSECPEFSEALAGGNVRNRTKNFIKQSKCGCSLAEPKVCCGPLPHDKEYNVYSSQLLSHIDPDSLEDSFLPPEDQCGIEYRLNEKIFGGTEPQVGEFPWMALLFYRLNQADSLDYSCGGSLINRRYVLSAAHCISGRSYRSLGELEIVRLGEHDVRKYIDCSDGLCGDPPLDIRVLHAYPHPEYNIKNKENDISLIRLAKRVEYTDFIRPICLDRSGKWEVNDDIVVSGWGTTQNDRRSPIKLKVTLPIADPSVCTQIFHLRYHISLTEGHLCLGGKNNRTDSCKGDSGGPAMRKVADGRWQAIGVVSFGHGCGVKGWPAVYTNVSRYYSWIKDTLQSTNLCTTEKEMQITRRRSEICRTPLNRQSECISLYDCPAMLSAFERRPLPSSVVTFLRRSQCGFDGYVPRVCCGPIPDQLEDSPPPVQRPSTPAPDPSDEGSNPDDALPSRIGECGLDTNGDRIYGGQFTELDEFPWMALMGYRKPSGRITYQCGGVLINHRYVLTAAHCIKGEVERQVGTLVTVRLGEYDTQNEIDCSDGVCADPPQDIPIQGVYANPGYNDKNINKKDDIGLVRLSRRAKYTFYVKPICLPDTSTRLSPGYDVYVAGWGKTLAGTNSPVKLKLQLPIYDKNQCKNKYKDLGANLIDKQICAGGTFSKDACRGDSGGPLMVKKPEGYWESVGIVSFGYGCGRDGWPGVYTSVASYRDWILETMRATNS